MGKDGFLYFSTHRGATNVTTDAYGYKGDWIIKCDAKTGKSEVVAHGPVPKHCIPNSVLDPERMIFYGGTAPGSTKDEANGVRFFAYDVANKKLLYSGPDGPPRYMIFAKSTGRIYYVPGSDGDYGPMMRYDPAKPTEAPIKIGASIGLRSATQGNAGRPGLHLLQGKREVDPDDALFIQHQDGRIQRALPRRCWRHRLHHLDRRRFHWPLRLLHPRRPRS